MCLHLEAAAKFHWALMPRPCQRNRLGDKKAADENTVNSKHQARQSFICLLTSSLVYLRCISQKRSGAGPRRCRVFSCFSFLERSGGSESGRDWGQQQTEGKKEEEEGAGLREFAGSLVYSVVVLTSEWTPADTGRWRLAHVNAEELWMQQTCVRLCLFWNLVIEFSWLVLICFHNTNHSN